ncbi:MAG TPA: D-alanyl-D-alanine carboxypeptidase/D-alanyl-D-alanine-endopeptidase [Acidobacteria bacterium]|nr:D-alanyl-D-alanine carboxypeptidase/D-alanyl-D-alanine-endopeptidase [Acidobacteriota bacterium]
MTRTHPFLLVGVAVALVALPSLREAKAQPSASLDDGAHRGYLAMRRTAGGNLEVVDELNADRLFVPASVLKVVTVASALNHLGADYRWITRLTATGGIDGGVLEGDLVIEPGGDPTWNDDFFDGGAAEPLAALARQVRERGVTRITGDLVVDAARFPGRLHPIDRGFGDLSYRFGTPTAGVALDSATITVRVAPGEAVGDPARVVAPDGVEVLNDTTTVGRERHGAGTLDFVPVWGTDTLLLRGEYPISEDPFVVAASDPAPERRAARRLHEALDAVGVTVEGAVRQGSPRVGSAEPHAVLAEFRSPPLRDLLERTLTHSTNWYADMLALTLGLEIAGTGRFDDGVEVIADFVEGLGPDADRAGRGTPRLWIVDGSGLSASNLVTPATLVRVLADVLEQPWGETLVAALAGPAEGTLAAWPRLPPIAAKTGTLRHTVGLAGIVDAESGTPILFCYFVNHHPERPAAARREIASALGRWSAGDPAR